jgi:hypothetical protein
VAVPPERGDPEANGNGQIASVALASSLLAAMPFEPRAWDISNPDVNKTDPQEGLA